MRMVQENMMKVMAKAKTAEGGMGGMGGGGMGFWPTSSKLFHIPDIWYLVKYQAI